VYGSPDQSPLMNYLTSFDGPMFKIFDTDDLEIWRDWIYSLKGPQPPFKKNQLDSFDAMKHLVERVGRTARAVRAHDTLEIFGPSPNNGQLIKQAVSVWLSISNKEDGGDPVNILKALIEPTNHLITCWASNASAFIAFLAPNNPMGSMFARSAAEVMGDEHHRSPLWTWREIVIRWIDDGCPFQSNGGFTISTTSWTYPTFSTFTCRSYQKEKN